MGVSGLMKGDTGRWKSSRKCAKAEIKMDTSKLRNKAMNLM